MIDFDEFDQNEERLQSEEQIKRLWGAPSEKPVNHYASSHYKEEKKEEEK